MVRAPFILGLLVIPTTIASGDVDNLGLANGYIAFETSQFHGKWVKDSQTLASLQPASNLSFDFLAYDFLPERAYDGAHHLGDVTFRYRSVGSTNWTNVDSASTRAPISSLNTVQNGVLTAADLASTLPRNLPVNVTREWLKVDNDLVLRINITNTFETSIELGSLGLPIYINSIFTNRNGVDVQLYTSLADPYIGLDAGYVRVTPVGGNGKALVITPFGSSPFEAWRFLDEPQGSLGYQTQTFEGNYEWQIHSLAWAENEWQSAEPWNTPTSKILTPSETYSVGLRFTLADSISTIDEAVVNTDTPLAVGFPGFVISMDAVASLVLNYSSPVATISTGGAFTISKDSSSYKLTPSGTTWGRAKVTITYANGKVQAINYYITKSAPETIGDLGHFLTTTQYYTNISDPFGRAPSVLSYDREINDFVVQDSRVWIAGLSDEAGAGSYLAATMKQAAQPVAQEIALIEDFIHKTLWTGIQGNNSYGVKASVFYYQPNVTDFVYDPRFDWTTWASWDKARAYSTVRAYNFVHATAAYWAMYRVARAYPDLVSQAKWDWYLNQSFSTIQFCLGLNSSDGCDYSEFGLMGETVVGELLTDLGREDFTDSYDALKASMKARADLWSTQDNPYGSEQAWDSTGQEGVYYWTNFFGYASMAAKTVNSIIGYMPTVPHWGWNGNARRYWDFIYGAKIQRIERQIHHYGSGLNALPLLSHYQQNPSPSTFYHLQVGYGGISGPLTNIDEDGFASAAFHSYPDTLAWDPYSGDYGPNFLALVLGQATYLVKHHVYGYVAFGGNIAISNKSVTVLPRDAVRKRLYIAPLGLKIELDAGVIKQFVYTEDEDQVTLTLVQAVSDSAAKASRAVIWLDAVGAEEGTAYTVNGAGEQTRGGWAIDLRQEAVEVKIVKT